MLNYMAFWLIWHSWFFAAPMVNAPINDAAPETREEILDYLDATRGARYRMLTEIQGLDFPPKAVAIRIYKKERELELWAGNNRDKLKKIAAFPVCAMDFEPGPKLKEGDKKTPEGVYALVDYYRSRNWFMWMDLRPEHTKERGRVGHGSAFRLCSNYPNAVDVQRSKSIGVDDPGSAICVHGNGYSVGCPSLQNEHFAAVYYFAMHHDVKRYGALRMTILPFRFHSTRELARDAARAASSSSRHKKLGENAILEYWRELQTQEEAFLKFPAI